MDMDRFTFRENEPKVKYICACCHDLIYEGDMVVKYEDIVCCDLQCLIKHIGVRYIIAGSEGDDE